MRLTSYLAAAWAGLLAACGSNLSVPPVAGKPLPANVAGPIASQGAASRNWDEYKLRAARRIHDSSGSETFSGPLPDPLQSIPVLQVQLHRDGSIRNIIVLRTPKFMPQTVEMATRAVRRAAPFGSVGHLPQPWQFNETFLYNDDLKFQLRSLVEGS